MPQDKFDELHRPAIKEIVDYIKAYADLHDLQADELNKEEDTEGSAHTLNACLKRIKAVMYREVADHVAEVFLPEKV